MEQRQLLAVVPLGNEFQVNPASSADFAQLLARPSQSIPNSMAGLEARNQAVAVDSDGDFVVVWTSYLDQDGNGQDGDGAGVFMRMFNRQGVAITGEVQVNTFTEGDQRNASVAMDADGDFVIVWESQFQDLYDGSAGIFAQRFNSLGQKVGAEFQVHSNTVNDQFNPAVSMNVDGNFVVTWESKAQDESFFNDVRAQAFNFDGERVGNELRVNDVNIPSFLEEANPAVAIARSGHFVIVWQGDGGLDGTVDSDILGRVFAPDGRPLGGEFTVNVSTANFSTINAPAHLRLNATAQEQRNAAIAMDADGNFIVVWESYQDNDYGGVPPESFGIYYRRFILNVNGPNGATPAVPRDSNVNPVFTNVPGFFALSKDVHPSVAMDADGDFVIVYEGKGSYDYSYSGYDSYGIWMMRYHAGAEFPVNGGGILETPGNINGVPIRVNSTTVGVQRHPSIAMEPDGDFVVVWDGASNTDSQGIHAQRFNETTDTAGSLVTDVLLNGKRLMEGDQVIEGGITQVAVIFDEQLSVAGGATGIHSVLNPNNWALLREGVEILGGVQEVAFSLDPATNKWTALVTFDSDGPLGPPGTATALTDGTYQLVARRSIRDVAGNPLASRGSVTLGADVTVNGFDFVRTFSVQVPISVDVRVNTTTAGAQSTLREGAQTIARDGDGNFVVVWSGNGTQPGQSDSQGVFFQRYDRDGTPLGGEQRVNTIGGGTQSNASVAMDADGDFVVTWSSYGHDAASGWDVFARRFDALGTPRDAAEFRVNSTTESIQRFSTVAMDVDGDFVIAWQSYQQDGSGYGIFAQRYNAAGDRLGGTNEVQRITINGTPSSGSFRLRLGNDPGAATTALVAYSSADRDDVIAQKIEDALLAAGIEAEVDARSATEFGVTFVGRGGSFDRPQLVPLDVSFVDGSTMSVQTTTPGVSGELLVNETTVQNQRFASVAMDAIGNFVVTWTSNGQNGDLQFETNVYYRRFDASGAALSPELLGNVSDIINPPNPPGQVIINNQRGSQQLSRVAMDLNGDFVITWTSYGTDGTGNGYGVGTGGENGVFARRFNSDGTTQGVFHPVTGEPVAVFRVNSFTDGNQQFSDVSMAADGSFVIVWESFQDDSSPVDAIPDSFGVYAQRFAPNELVGSVLFGGAGQIGAEFRVNTTLVGEQRNASVASDLQGNFAVVWTSVGQDGSGDGVYLRRFAQPTDETGPIVADVLVDGEQVLPGQALETTGITEIVVTFSEELSTEGGDTGFNSVLNPDNWALVFNGGVLEGVITLITFGFNPASGKWEAHLFLDSDETEPGAQPLVDGNYILGISDRITDIEGNPLDGDFDGSPGAPFTRSFTVLPEQAQVQVEFLVNTTVPGTQRTGGPRTVAVDADGDFVVVWTAYGQDGDAPGEGNIYVQRYTRDGVPLGTEFRVNSTSNGDPSYTVGRQNAPSIAIDGDGDFVVTWSGYGRDGDASDQSNIYARRFSSSGAPLGNPTLVNQTIGGTQKSSSVAVDVDGDYVVVWASSTGDGGGYGIFARQFSAAGVAKAGQFQVNLTTDGNQLTPVVGVHATGAMVFAWTTPDLIGIGTDIAARRFLPDGTPVGGEFIVNTGTAGNATGLTGVQRSPAVGVDLAGDFVIAWSSAGQDGSGYGIYAQRFNPGGIPQGLEFQANVSTLGNQEMPSVSLDHSGDFVIAWSGNGNQPDAEDSAGVFARRFAFDGTPLAPPLGADGTNEFRVNTTIVGTQQFASVGVDGEGDIVVGWTGPGIGEQGGDAPGVFARLFNISGDDAGPIVTDVQVGGMQVASGAVLSASFSEMVVVFGERLSQVDGDLGFESVNNPANWALFRNGIEIPGAISQIAFALNPVNQKWEARLTVDGNGFAGGTAPLPPGEYQLVVRDFITDTSSNALDGDFNGTTGFNFTHLFSIADVGGDGGAGPGTQPIGAGGEFQVNTTIPGNQNSSAVAIDGAGNFVVVWAGPSLVPLDPTIPPPPAGSQSVFFQMFDVAGNPIGTEVEIVESRSLTPLVASPDVARDRDGNFIIVWTGTDVHDTHGIFAQPYTPLGAPLGAPFIVNTFTANVQNKPAVAMGAGGDFVVTWTSYGQDGDIDGVYAVRYGSNGERVGGEFRVNATTANRQENSRVALDDNGNFVIVWDSFNQDTSSWGVFGRRYNAAATPTSGEFLINTTTANAQRLADVAMDADGDFVVAWQSLNQDGSGYGIYARRFDKTGGAGDEFRVNRTTLNWQQMVALDMDDAGNFTVTWASFGQDEDGNGTLDGNGIFGRSYRADGIEVTHNVTGAPLGEYVVNLRVDGDQTDPAIAMDPAGNFVVVWTGQDNQPFGPEGNSTGIFGRRFRVSPPTPIGGGNGGGEGDGGNGGGGGGAPPPAPKVLAVDGTAGFDSFEFTAGPTLATSTLRLNGNLLAVPDSVTEFRLNGFGGGDRAVINGSGADETAELWAGSAKFTTANYIVLVSDTPNISVFAGGGNKSVVVHGSAMNDSLTMTSAKTTITVPGYYTNEVYGFAQTEVHSGGGEDQARFFDSPGNDVLMAAPTSTRLYGVGFDNRAYGFTLVEATASVGNDLAVFYDSPGNDVLVAVPQNARMYGVGFDNRAYGFGQLEANSGAGKDVGLFYDSPGNDVLFATPGNTRLYGVGFDHRAYGFSHVEGYSTGGSDLAVMQDSAGNDVYTAAPKNVRMLGGAFDNRAYDFAQVEGSSTRGDDMAVMYDSAANDVMFAHPGNVRMLGAGFDNRAYGFRTVEGYASKGNDAAMMYDSAGDDTVTASPSNVRFQSPGFDNRAYGFPHVETYSKRGTDTAMFYDSLGNDTFVGAAKTAQLKGDDFDNRAYGFHSVRAMSSGGVDAAFLYGSTGDDLLLADFDHRMTKLEAEGTETMIERFVEVTATSPGVGNDQAMLIDSALDDALLAQNNLAQVTNAVSTGRFYNFKQVTAQGGKGGQNTASIQSIDYVLTNNWS